MPIKPENKNRYPLDWLRIRQRILKRANNRCEICGAINYMKHPETGATVILTIMHLNHTPEDSRPENLKAGCQKCHNGYDAEHRQATRRQTKEAQVNKNQTQLFGG